SSYGKKYFRVNTPFGLIFCHRIAWFLFYKKWPRYIDHIDGNGLNNAIENLRDVEMKDNLLNKRIYSKNKIGIAGVYYKEITNNFYVKITKSKKKIHVGVFDDFFEACCARKSAENKLGFHENHGTVRPL